MLEQTRPTNQNLLKKVLWPYILLLLTLAMVISLGSSMLLQSRLINATQQRLIHIQTQVYNEFKQLEQLLDKSIDNATQVLPLASQKLEQNLPPHHHKLDIAILEFGDPGLSPQLRELLEKARKRKSVYISAFFEEAQEQSLIAIKPLTNDRLLVIRHPLDQVFLEELGKRYDSQFYLFDQQGKQFISADKETLLPALEREDLEQINSGGQIIKITEFPETRLISYSPLPLGHDSIFLLGTAQSLTDIETLIFNHRLYLLGIIGLSLLICTTLFRSLLIRLFSPLNALIQLYDKIKAGDHKARIDIDESNRSQLMELCIACNQLLDDLAEKERNLEKLSFQLSKLEDLKAHNLHLRKNNLELENRAVNLKEQNQKLSALFKITQAMVSSLDQQLLYERILQTLKDTLDCSICVLYIFQKGSDTLQAVKVQGLHGIELKLIQTKLGKGAAGEAALNQKICHLPDLSATENRPSYGNEVVAEGSLLAVPLTVQNRLIGVVNLHQPAPNAFNATAIQIAQAITNQASIAIENARLYEKTKTLSATDELTGLSNRRQFQEYLLRELAQSRRHHNSFSILMIDIDHFKLYNDFHGHLKGDIVLKKVASLLLQNTRGVDLVARFGGEEFVMLLPKSDKQNSLAVAEKLRLCIEKEYFTGAEQSQPGQRLTISVGVSHFPGDSSDIYDLMNLADTALYEAKKQGRNKCIGWDPKLIPEGE